MSREIRRIPVGFEWPTWTVRRIVAPVSYASFGFPPSGPSPEDLDTGRVHAAEYGMLMAWVDAPIPMLDRTLSEDQAAWDAREAEHGDALGYIGMTRPGSVECDDPEDDTVRRVWVEVNGCPTLFGRRAFGPLVPYFAYCPEGWPPADECGWCYVETVSEGSPISPVLPTREAMRAWLMDFQSFSEDAVDRFLETGSSVGSFMRTADGMFVSGVEALSGDPRPIEETGF